MTQPTNDGGLRIIRLAAQNFKRLVAIDITPAEDVVMISGENGAGKSTVFDAIALPEPVDATAIRAKIDNAKKVNASIEWRENRARLEAEADALEAESKALTAAMAAREKSKVDAIAAAKLPVPGLGFDETGVTFDGFPFRQAATSDRLVTSVAIGMAASPKLRVILVRDASLLTAKNRERIKALAKGKSYQVWEEIATEQGEGVGIVIEDGTVKGTEVANAE
jgi:ABC-type dipeptide/oligopeptide/nickel transport system ATPase component